MQIKLLGKEDADDYFELRLRALKEEPDSFGASYEESKLLTAKQIEDRLECSDSAFIYGAYLENLSGMVGFYRKSGLKVGHKGVIWGMYTSSEARGQGLGRKLLECLIARARTISGLEELQLTVVTTNNAAFQLYKSIGFEEYAIEYGALKVDGRYLDERFMFFKL